MFAADLPTSPLEQAVISRDDDVLALVQNSLAEDRVQLALQPIVSAQDQGAVAFYEGLVRLQDNGGRTIPARQFIGQIEETELGREIDCASLRLGLRSLHRHPAIRLSVNMSARSLGDSKWRRTLEDGLARRPNVAERLILEINERSVVQLPEVLSRFMKEMQPMGVSFALDDFGAGMTSFRQLGRFFFDLVKIESGFIRRIQESPDNQLLTEALVQIAHQFEMFAVATGVESRGEADILCKLGVDCLQGFHFGAPRLEK